MILSEPQKVAAFMGRGMLLGSELAFRDISIDRLSSEEIDEGRNVYVAVFDMMLRKDIPLVVHNFELL